jgi:hypothetical protein
MQAAGARARSSAANAMGYLSTIATSPQGALDTKAAPTGQRTLLG